MFSVIMAARNAAPYLRQSVQSILDQTYADFELIIADDSSTDDTLRIARELAARDGRIRVIARSENGGCGAARTSAIEAARRDWLVIQDADDTAVPERLAHYAKVIAEQPDVIGWAGMIRYMGPDGSLHHAKAWGPHTREAFDAMRRRREPIWFFDSTLAVRRECFWAAGGYERPHAVDFDFMDRLSDHGYVLELPVVLNHYRMHHSNTSLTKFHNTRLEMRYVWRRRETFSAQHPPLTWDAFLDWYDTQTPEIRRQWERVDLSRFYRQHALNALASRRYLAFVSRIFRAVFYDPGWLTSKVIRRAA